jgi:DNA topoisomerase-1
VSPGVRPTRAIPYRGGLTRRRRGRGLSYHDATGAAVAAPVRARIEELVIPSAWREVWLSERDRDHIRAVGYDDADDHVRSLTDAAHTAKDLRARNATVVGAVAFAEHGWAGGAGLSATALERAEAATTCRVARALGNTPAVARSSYVDPRVVRAFEEGHTVAAGLRCIPRGAGEHRTRVAVGRAVLRLLERHN